MTMHSVILTVHDIFMWNIIPGIENLVGLKMGIFGIFLETKISHPKVKLRYFQLYIFQKKIFA